MSLKLRFKKRKLAVGTEGCEDMKESETVREGDRSARPLRATGREFQIRGAA